VNVPITIRPEGEGADVRTLFTDEPVGRLRVFSGTALHLAAAGLLLVLVQFLPEKAFESILPDRIPKDIVWIAQPGPGGGGGGNPNPEPPRVREPEPVAVPAVKPPEPVEVPPPPVFEPPTVLPSDLLSAAPDATLIAPPGPPAVGGRGTGDGAGPGQGRGVGPGRDGGIGGGPYQPGNGVSSPIPTRQVKPAYTADAMRARVQGIVGLDCVVQSNGEVGDCDIVQPMRQAFGLNEEALKAARQWRFRPGIRQGEPVPVLVRIELEFNLR
jgi:TonB family protein